MNHNEGIVAEFSTTRDIINAAKETRSAGYTKFETFSPFPIHGMDDAMGLTQSKIGWLSITGGLLGCTTGIVLQVWTSAYAYPLIISGKEFASLPAFVPVVFELSILLTAFFTVFGMFAINKLPQWHNTIFNHSTFHKVTDDGFFLSIEGNDPKYNENTIKEFLKKIGGINIELVKDEQ